MQSPSLLFESTFNVSNGSFIKSGVRSFILLIAVVFPDGREFTVRGTCEGYIADHREGNNGFGYDPLFVGELGCFGLLSDEQKDSISHRGRALAKMVENLKEYI